MLARTALAFALALLPGCGGGAEANASAAEANSGGATNPMDARSWEIGPIIRGRNYSEGMPLHPTPRRDGSWHIDLPQAPGSVHYVTFPHGPLTGKRRIIMRYRVEAAPGVKIVPKTVPSLPSMLTLYFQRAGDRWSGRRGFEAHRWYATFATKMPIEPGTYEMVAPLAANWTAVQTSSAKNNPGGFQAAVAEADRVGFVLGGGDGYGHGVFATGRARLVVTSFRVE